MQIRLKWMLLGISNKSPPYRGIPLTVYMYCRALSMYQLK